MFIDGDVSSDAVYGQDFSGVGQVEYSIPAYTGQTWTEGNFYNNGSQVVVNTVLGNLGTGNTLTIGGPIYRDKVDQDLRLRTIVSKTPEISVEYDDYFIKISGTSAVSDVENVGTGVGLYSGTTGSTLLFKTLIGGGDTTILDNGAQVIISSTGGGTGGSGENVTKTITQSSHGFVVNDAIGWSAGVYSKAIADGTYDGEIVGVVSEVVNTNTFNLTQSGYISGFTGLVMNSTYFVSPTVAGNIQLTAPTTIGELVRPILVANSTESGWILPYPGYFITEPITGGTGGDQIYSGESPSNVTVGALLAGATLTGRTISSILEEMLITTIYPTIIEPTRTFSDNAGIYEYGTVIDIDFTATFNKGSIYLGATFQNFRSDGVNTYYYSGPGLPASVSSTLLLDAQEVTGWTVSATTAWQSCVGYDCGAQPIDSDGCDSGSPLAAGTTAALSAGVSGFHPYYWGTYASGGQPAGVNRPASTNDLVTGGTKVLNCGNSNITVSFASTSDDYLWFAIPSTSTSKTCWYVDTINNEKIEGGIGPGCCLFPVFSTVAICSAQGCWNNINYKVYVSNYQSAISQPMDIRNS